MAKGGREGARSPETESLWQGDGCCHPCTPSSPTPSQRQKEGDGRRSH